MKKLLSVLVCVLLASMAFGDWELVKGPVVYKNAADAVALDASTFIKIVGNTVFKTANMGDTWKEVVLPEGVALKAISAASATVAYACADGGLIFKTTNAGDDWTQVGDTVNNKENLMVIDAIDANTVFVGGKGGVFLKSSNGGSTWAKSNYGTLDINGGIAFATATNGVMLNNGNIGTIYVTKDGGDNWTDYLVTLPLGTTSKRNYCASAVRGKSTFLVAGYHNIIWKSTDGGDNWTLANEFTYDLDRIVDVQALDENNYVAATSAADILVSKDGGTSWDTLGVGSGQSCQALAYSSPTNGMVFLSYSQEFKTTNGTTFTPLNEWPGISFWGISFPTPNSVMLASWGGGELTYSDDYGKTFSYPDNYVSGYNGNIYELHFADANLGYFGGGSGTIKKTSDGGKTWTFKENPMAELANKHINMMHIAPNGDVYAGGTTAMIVKSTDEGETWESVPVSGATQTVYDMCVFSNGEALAAMGGGFIARNVDSNIDSMVAKKIGTKIYRGIDERNGVVIVTASGGEIWKTTISDLDTLHKVFQDPGNRDIYSAKFVDDNTVYVVGQKSLVYKSEDAGETWTELSVVGLEDEYVLQHIDFNGFEVWAVGAYGIVMKNTITPRYAVTAHVDMSIQIKKGNFTDANNKLDIMGSFDNWTDGIPMSDEDGDSVYSACLGEFTKGTVLEFRCRRNGAWDNTEEFPSGSNRTYTVLAEADQNIPVFFYNNETEVAIAGIPASFELAQNYPNPFNPVTSMKFAIPKSEMVSLNVYDISGRKVVELVNRQMEAGYYSVNFNAATLPSGIYFYRLNAGDFNAVRKMTLLK